MEKIKGYKVFNNNWQCRGKQYSCPGTFEEDVDPICCDVGMHFCQKLTDCFNYYDFNPSNKVAEVIAIGDINKIDDKCCTNKLQIVREISWEEVLKLCNTGDCNTGNQNTGDWNTGDQNAGKYNTGDWNTGNYNAGDYNTGYRNTGDRNTGNWNTGNYNVGNRNTGNYNTGDWNTGDYNTGYRNTGNRNTGDRNTGNRNTGNYNVGNRNTGDWNTGDYNTGYRNTGNYNVGNQNTGDWNTASHETGCFNTKELYINLFNKPSTWTYDMWYNSIAQDILSTMPQSHLEWIDVDYMTDDEKINYPEYKTTGGFLKKINATDRQNWWDSLNKYEKLRIKAIPNFDRDIFKEITGITVEEDIDKEDSK